MDHARFVASSLSASAWWDCLQQAAATGAPLLDLYAQAETRTLHAVLKRPQQRQVISLSLADGEKYPDISGLYPVARRWQRVIAEMTGLEAAGDSIDRRPWLRHGWPTSVVPLRDTPPADLPWQDRLYDFVRVAGPGVHEIAVGPVHAGTIEPGHFRFSVVGEKVLRLEERLGYTHKGIELMATQRPIEQVPALVARSCGDSTVALSWAYAQALEELTGCVPPLAAELWRAVLLERERIANHLGDLGALAQDAGWALGMTWFSTLRERWLRCQRHYFGHRLMMDCILPGGVHLRNTSQALREMGAEYARLSQEVDALHDLYAGHEGLQERLIGAGCLSTEQASRCGVIGLVGRASGLDQDLRRDLPWGIYQTMSVKVALHTSGDVAARVAVRFDEIQNSLQLLDELTRCLSTTGEAGWIAPPALPTNGCAWGAVESWRGELLCALHLVDGKLTRLHLHEPSWNNWPALEWAIMGNIVADFPLINKSFNLAYAGCDL